MGWGARQAPRHYGNRLSCRPEPANPLRLDDTTGAVRQLYRHRNAEIILDDAHGIWTEADQSSAAAEAFVMFDRQEAGHDKSMPR